MTWGAMVCGNLVQPMRACIASMLWSIDSYTTCFSAVYNSLAVLPPHVPRTYVYSAFLMLHMKAPIALLCCLLLDKVAGPQGAQQQSLCQ